MSLLLYTFSALVNGDLYSPFHRYAVIKKGASDFHLTDTRRKGEAAVTPLPLTHTRQTDRSPLSSVGSSTCDHTPSEGKGLSPVSSMPEVLGKQGGEGEGEGEQLIVGGCEDSC